MLSMIFARISFASPVSNFKYATSIEALISRVVFCAVCSAREPANRLGPVVKLKHDCRHPQTRGVLENARVGVIGPVVRACSTRNVPTKIGAEKVDKPPAQLAERGIAVVVHVYADGLCGEVKRKPKRRTPVGGAMMSPGSRQNEKMCHFDDELRVA